MYNEIIKLNYIEHAKSNSIVIENYLLLHFNRIEKYENMLNKDVAEFSVPQIMEMYKSFFFNSIETLMLLNNTLKRYASYCLYRDLIPDGQNHFAEIDNNILIQCINNTYLNNSIISKDDLMVSIEMLKNPSDQFLILAIFEGIKGKEFTELVNANINQIEGNKIHLCTGRVLEISDKLIQYAKESTETYEYNTYGKEDEILQEFKFKENDNRILKDLYNVNVSTPQTQKRNIYSKLVRVKEYMGYPELSAKSLSESGRCDYIVQLMDSNKYDNISECIIENREMLEYRYGNITSVSRHVLKYCQLLNNYYKGEE